MSEPAKCKLCGDPMPPGEEMFNYHGYSGNCPKPPLPHGKESEIQEWIDKCINGAAGFKSFYERENLGQFPDDLALAGANWIIRCLVQPHAKEVLDCVIAQATKNATTPTGEQP